MTYRAANEVELAENQVAIAITSGSFGSHLGIVYCLEAGHAEMLHLAFHKRLVLESYPPVDPWAVFVLRIPEPLSIQLVAILHSMATRYHGSADHGIDYGINLYDSLKSIAPDGEYQLAGNADGLTCASFIAAIFEAMELPIVDISTWKCDEVNRIWGRAVVCFLHAFGAPSHHIQNVEKNNLGLRLRPEEVAAAAEQFVPGAPASYQLVQKGAKEIVYVIRKLCGLPSRGDDSNPYGRCTKSYYDGLDELEVGRFHFLRALKALQGRAQRD